LVGHLEHCSEVVSFEPVTHVEVEHVLVALVETE
jgi:hypothetical protein